MCVLASFWLVAFVLKIKCAFEALSVHVTCVVHAWALLRMKAPLGGGVCGPSAPWLCAARSWILLTIFILGVAIPLPPFDVDAACSNLSPVLLLGPGDASLCSILKLWTRIKWSNHLNGLIATEWGKLACLETVTAHSKFKWSLKSYLWDVLISAVQPQLESGKALQAEQMMSRQTRGFCQLACNVSCSRQILAMCTVQQEEYWLW